jgi:cytochrome b pre-mRNA-processing protein 3
MILSLFRKDPARSAAESLFEAAVEQSRRPEFYTALGVEDSVEGRFELMALHVYLLLRRLKGAAGASRLSQRLLDAMFANVDDALREIGVGDLSMGRKIRKMAESFYGRIGAYEAALAAPSDDALAAAIARNVYGAEQAAGVAGLAGYVRRAVTMLDNQPAGRIESGIAQFPATVISTDPAEGAS